MGRRATSIGASRGRGRVILAAAPPPGTGLGTKPPPRPSGGRPPASLRSNVVPDATIAKLASDAGFKHDARSKDPRTKISELHGAVAIALAESGGNANALRRVPGQTDYVHGLWQIKAPWTRGLLDPRANAAAAFAKFNANGRRFGKGSASTCMWSVYCNGTHIPYLLRAQNAIRRANIGVGIVSRVNPLDDPGGFVDLLPAYLKIAAGAWGLTATAIVLVYIVGRRTGVAPAVSSVAKTAAMPARAARAPLRASRALVPGAEERRLARGEATSQRAAGRRELARARVVTETGRGGRDRVRVTSRREGRAAVERGRLAEGEAAASRQEQKVANLDALRRRRRQKTPPGIIQGVG